MNRHVVVVPPALAGSRLDQALAKLIPGESRSAIAKLIDSGGVSVNGVRAAKSSGRVESGDEVTAEIPDAVATSIREQEIPLRIVYQDEKIAVVDKPAGLVVHPSAGHDDSTLVNALLFHLRDLSGIGGELRPGIVHRLDKDTSGLIVVAKDDDAHRKLTSAWATGVKKEYLAIVYGTPSDERGTISAPIGRDPRDRKRMAVVAGGRPAETVYSVAAVLRYSSLVRCRLKTGRTHQIRVHLKSIGHPIIGDPLYSGPQWKGIPDKKLQKAIAGFPRQALHATKLSFPHPATGEIMTFESELPEDMAELVKKLTL